MRPRETIAATLLQPVWHLYPPGSSTSHSLKPDEAAAYLNHYERLLHRLGDKKRNLSEIEKKAEKVTTLVNLIQDHQKLRSSIKVIKDNIKKESSSWLFDRDDDKAVALLLQFAVELWLFVRLDLENETSTLDEAVKECLSKVTGKALQLEKLSEDFSAKSMLQKVGLKIQITGNLAEHLTMDTSERFAIRVFGHAHAVRQYADTESRSLYPKDFLEEVQRTMKLLFSTTDPAAQRRAQRYGRRYQADLEAFVAVQNKLDLSTYPVFGERLEKIQERYNRMKPRSISQWWFDRRSRGEWAALWIAVVAFFLAAVFGIISSICSIWQVVLLG